MCNCHVHTCRLQGFLYVSTLFNHNWSDEMKVRITSLTTWSADVLHVRPLLWFAARQSSTLFQLYLHPLQFLCNPIKQHIVTSQIKPILFPSLFSYWFEEFLVSAKQPETIAETIVGCTKANKHQGSSTPTLFGPDHRSVSPWLSGFTWLVLACIYLLFIKIFIILW